MTNILLLVILVAGVRNWFRYLLLIFVLICLSIATGRADVLEAGLGESEGGGFPRRGEERFSKRGGGRHREQGLHFRGGGGG